MAAGAAIGHHRDMSDVPGRGFGPPADSPPPGYSAPPGFGPPPGAGAGAGGYGNAPPPGYGPPPAGYGAPGYRYGGQDPGDGRVYAGWWRRAAAAIVDGLLVGIPVALLTGGFETSNSDGGFEFQLQSNLLGTAVFIIYAGILNGSARGQTLGKMLLGIRVRSAETGGAIGVGMGLVRAVIDQALFFACFLPGLINVLSPLWDDRMQAWHDKAVKSVVVPA